MTSQPTTLTTPQTTTAQIPSECDPKTYHLLDNPERQSSNTKKPSGGWHCDGPGYSSESPDWKGNGWYRFKYGSRIPTTPLPKRSCGTYAPGHLVGSYPETVGNIVSAKVCFPHGRNNCHKETKIKIRNCGSFFVYELKETPWCQLGYCAVFINDV